MPEKYDLTLRVIYFLRIWFGNSQSSAKYVKIGFSWKQNLVLLMNPSKYANLENKQDFKSKWFKFRFWWNNFKTSSSWCKELTLIPPKCCWAVNFVRWAYVIPRLGYFTDMIWEFRVCCTISDGAVKRFNCE